MSVLPDDDDDDGESLHIGFGSLTEGVGIGRNSGKTINFRDNDGIDTWKVFFGESTCTATEGGASARRTVIGDSDLAIKWRHFAIYSHNRYHKTDS